MNLKELKELIEVMNENGLAELEIEREGLKVRLKKLPTGGIEQRIEMAPAPVYINREAPNQEAAAAPKTEAPGKKLIEVRAPMVGTFYEAPSPESPPYVEVGSKISAGQVLCILEAMKLMNEIKSEVSGKIVEKLVENAQPIEYGQVLFLVEPD